MKKISTMQAFVFHGPDGTPIRKFGDYVIYARSPIAQRWVAGT